jgi:hypothetical protein
VCPSPTAFRKVRQQVAAVNLRFLDEAMPLPDSGGFAGALLGYPSPAGPDADVRVAWSPRGNSRRRTVIEPVDKADGLGDALNLRHSIGEGNPDSHARDNQAVEDQESQFIGHVILNSKIGDAPTKNSVRGRWSGHNPHRSCGPVPA